MSLRLVAVSVLVTAVVAGSAPATTGGPPAGLTQSGRARWQFEALLRDRFRGNSVSAHYNGSVWNFDCYPLARWQPYSFEFKSAQGSRFHVSRKTRPPRFGNYPIPIKVKGHLVACDTTESHFLITYGDAVGLWLACLRP